MAEEAEEIRTGGDSGAGGEKKRRHIPTTFTILLLCIVAAAVGSWLASTVTTEVRPATLADITTAPLLGFQDAIQVCMFVLVLGGFIAIVNKTKALDDGITVLVRRLGDHELMLIPVLMILFGICGSTYGMSEETVPFYILLSSVTYAMGFDTMVGALIIAFGAGLGCVGGTINPFSVGVANASLMDMGIEVNQGITISIGLIIFVISEAMGIAFVMRYAKRVKADPDRSAMTVEEREAAEATYGGEKLDMLSRDVNLSGSQKLTLVLFALSFVVMIISFVPWESFGINFFVLGGTADDPSTAWSAFLTGLPLGQWYFVECGTWFLIMAIVIGIAAHMSEREIVDTFIGGASDLVGVALIIAVARGVSVLMASTGLDIWLLNVAADALAGVSAIVFAPASFLMFFLISFPITSSSGLATVSMPIMGPLAVSLSFSPEVMVMIFTVANAIVAMIAPTNGALIAGLELSKVSYATYLKCVMRFIVVLALVTCAVLTVAMMVV
jgi:uncharacterized ion transporter superfamily protein YfcC